MSQKKQMFFEQKKSPVIWTFNFLFNFFDITSIDPPIRFKHSASLHIYAPLPFAFPIGSKNI